MRTSIILLALICISNWSYGQDYDLNTYQYRYQKYQGLLANFSLASQGGNSSIDIQDSSKTSTYDSKSNGNSINTSINPGYFSFTNLDNIQKTLSVDFSDNFIFGMSNSIQTGNTLNSSFNNNIAQLSVIATNRYYYGSKFDLVNISTQLNRISMTNEQTSTRYFRETNNKSTSIDWEVKVGRGKGRLEYVSDAVAAMFLLKDLETELGTNYTNEQISSIANSITQIRNQRYLDTRLGTKKQLQLLDSALGTQNLNYPLSINYFTILNDNWQYAQQVMRNSGARWTYFMENYGNFGRNSSTASLIQDSSSYSISKRKSRTLSHDIGVDYDNSKQLSIYHERSFGAFISTGIESTVQGSRTKSDTVPVSLNDNFRTYPNVYWHSKFSAYWQHLYQPNTRNIMIARLSTEILYNRQLAFRDNKQSTITDNSVLPDVIASLSYYKWISPKFNFTVNLNSTYNRSKIFKFIDTSEQTQYDSGFTYSANAGFVYQLF